MVPDVRSPPIFSSAPLPSRIRSPLTRLLFVANWLTGPLSFLHLSLRTVLFALTRLPYSRGVHVGQEEE